MTRRAALLAALLASAQPPAAQPADTGDAAFARRDFAAAAALWRQEAAAGSAPAKLGLGLVNDLGLGMPRDAAKALRWYLEAAAGGVAEAQFNVGVMMDAGTGVPRDAAAAAVWYAQAAANGHDRAAYDLGLLYESGDGVPRNPDLARYWLGRAAKALPAAAERLAGLEPTRAGDRHLEAPVALAGSLAATGGRWRGALVWSAAPQPDGTRFLVELAQLPDKGETWGRVIVSETTEASAVIVTVPDEPASYAWRVVAVLPDAAREAAADWQRLGSPSADVLPQGRVTLHVGVEDVAAARLARELTASFSDAGLWVRTEIDALPPAASDVRYGYGEDASLAGAIAAFLPVLRSGDARRVPGLAAAPGEIVVRLVGGPSDEAPAAVASIAAEAGRAPAVPQGSGRLAP